MANGRWNNNFSTQKREAILEKYEKEKCSQELHGHFSILFSYDHVPEKLFGLHCGAPLLVAQSSLGLHAASDLQALLPFTPKIRFLDPGSYFVMK